MRRAWVGGGLLLLLGVGSLVGAQLVPGVLAAHCPLGQDLVRPDRTVCELAFGGLWVSLAVGLCAPAALVVSRAADRPEMAWLTVGLLVSGVAAEAATRWRSRRRGLSGARIRSDVEQRW